MKPNRIQKALNAIPPAKALEGDEGRGADCVEQHEPEGAAEQAAAQVRQRELLHGALAWGPGGAGPRWR